MQIKTTTRNHLKLVKMTFVRKSATINAGRFWMKGNSPALILSM